MRGHLADDLGADLSLLHVVGPTESERVLEQTLQIAIGHLRSRAHPPLWRGAKSPNVIVRAGSPARLVAEMARRRKAGSASGSFDGSSANRFERELDMRAHRS